MFVFEIFPAQNIMFCLETVQTVFHEISKSIPIVQKGRVNIVFVDGEAIQQLNATYRNKDKVTDVLSFHYYDDFSGLWEEDIAGEIVLCEECIIFQGKEYGLGTEFEFYKLLIHSLLHLLGFDHEEDEDFIQMQEQEEKIWTKIFVKNEK